MGALQPGLPSPTAIPPSSFKIIINLKDCFYTIPLYPSEFQRFVFSVPSVNYLQEPMLRFQWKVLPQGMANSPILYQKFVQQAIQTTREEYSTVLIIHYMDDILLAHNDNDLLNEAFSHMKQHLNKFGLQISSDKIQNAYPYSYLGYRLKPMTFSPQKLKIDTSHLHTLHDFQTLLGEINWIRPSLKLSTGELKPLFALLNGDTNPASPRTLTSEASQTLCLVEEALQSAQLLYCDISKPWSLLILPSALTPTGALYQQGVLQWIHGSSLVAERIQQGRRLSIQILGQDPAFITVPYSSDQFCWLMNMNDSFPLALEGFTGQILHHFPKDKILYFASQARFIFPSVLSPEPLHTAVVLFTDGSSNGRAVLVTPTETKVWQLDSCSAQEVELFAVYQAFLLFSSPFNLYSDSQYVVHVLAVLETVPLITTSNRAVFQLFQNIQQLLQQRRSPCFIGHIRGHSSLPGPLALGNASADSFTHIFLSQQQLAEQSHTLHHQSARSLRYQFKITCEAARQIVKSCSTCSQLLPVPHFGVNPRGLRPNDLWQMDVTHCPSFGKLRYLHVTVDTYLFPFRSCYSINW